MGPAAAYGQPARTGGRGHGHGQDGALQTQAESFSGLGVPVFVTDIRGDLAGVSQPGEPRGSIAARIADDQGLLFLNLKDLRSMTAWVGENRRDFLQEYGQISPASIGTTQRGLIRLEEERAARFFGEPALRLEDLLLTDLSGRGIINILAAAPLLRRPRLYAPPALVAAVRTVRATARGGHPGAAPPDAHIRRGPSAVPGHALRTAGKSGTSGAPHPVQRRGRVFHRSEPGRLARLGPEPARQPGAARSARVHPGGPQSRACGGPNLPPQSPVERGGRHRHAGHGRGSVFFPGRQGRSAGGGTRPDSAARRPGGPRQR